MLYAEPWSILKTSKCCVLLNILYKKALDCWYIIVKIEEKNTGQRSAQQVKQLWWEDGDGEAMGSRMLWRLAAPPHRQSASTAPPGSIISDYYIIPTSYNGRCGRQTRYKTRSSRLASWHFLLVLRQKSYSGRWYFSFYKIYQNFDI